uniref:Uncharacterized protein n=1 Tax=Cacopsylla melanoneura TaxID=428564 RepID=A0A8D8Z3U8_9HEMI
MTNKNVYIIQRTHFLNDVFPIMSYMEKDKIVYLRIRKRRYYVGSKELKISHTKISQKVKEKQKRVNLRKKVPQVLQFHYIFQYFLSQSFCLFTIQKGNSISFMRS